MRAPHRRLSGVCLVLFLFVFGGLPLADAVLAASERSLAAHVEDGTERHSGGHDHQSCQLCRAIDRNEAGGAGASPAPPRVARVSGALPRSTSRPPAPLAGGVVDARAPPRA